jgi:aspartate racemase
MKLLGMIGGLGPESTVDYYKSIISAYRAARNDGSYPALIINSVDLQKAVDLVTANDLAALAEYLAGEVARLAAAGADFGLLTANTPHIVFDEVQRRSPIPLISIVEVTCARAKSLHLTRLGLFGTRFTMQAGFYQSAFLRDGMEIVTPDAGEQTFIHEKYMKELIVGEFRAETRDQLVKIAARMRTETNIQALILAGTELPLLLPAERYAGIPVLNTTEIHVQAAVAMMLSPNHRAHDLA